MTSLTILEPEKSTCRQTGSTAPSDGDESLVSGRSLIDRYLEEQQSLSAVDAFSRWHGQSERMTSRYRSLLPAVSPGSGQQYAFEVDLDRCSGCKSCVAVCHTLNGLDESETWRDVGLLVGGSRTEPMIQHVTSACHHCLEPACMTACPVNAYEKDPLTGIVKHLDDQCFGCQYCTMACPYDVPKYHAGKGIVRKCDMCSARLAVGEPPACVQACPHEAISIRIVDCQQVADDAEAAVFLPAAPDPQITLPTTTYKTRKVFPRNFLPVDYTRVNPQHAHWPLVIMLVLTQLSVGAFTAWLMMEPLLTPKEVDYLRPLHAVSALGFGLLALAASLFHLGRPHLAYRAILGLKHSWLSREIVAFGLFATLAAAYSAAVISPQLLSINISPTFVKWLGWGVALSGFAAIGCSIMIYVFTRRECWSFARVGFRFLLTSTLLGSATLWLSILLAMLIRPTQELSSMLTRSGPILCQTLITVTAIKLLWESAIFRHLLSRRMTSMQRSALLLIGELSRVNMARFGLGVLGGIFMPAMLTMGDLSILSQQSEAVKFVATAGLLFVACIGGEVLERYLFFAACAAPRMPGGIR